MNFLESNLRAENYRIVIEKTIVPNYPQHKWAEYYIYRPGGVFPAHSSQVCAGTYEEAFQRAEKEALVIIKKDLRERAERREKFKNMFKRKKRAPKVKPKTIFVNKEGERAV